MYCNVVPRCRDNEYREDPGDEVALSRHKMALYRGETNCELRGDVSWGGNDLQPGVIELCNVRGWCRFEVRKTTGANKSARVCKLINRNAVSS